jgi:hypothetical protein
VTLVDSDRTVEFTFTVKVNPHRTWNSITSEWVSREVPLFTKDQWVFIEKVALETLREMLGTQVEDLITPEVDFVPDGSVFPATYGPETDGLSDEELEKRENLLLEGAGAVIDVLEAFTNQLDEEIGKRDI